MDSCTAQCNRFNSHGINTIDFSAIICFVVFSVLSAVYGKHLQDLGHTSINICDVNFQKEDHGDIVPSYALYVFGIAAPICALTLTHCVPRFSRVVGTAGSSVGLVGPDIKKLTTGFWRGLLYYGFDISLVLAFTHIFKSWLRYTRPSGVWLCNPNNFRSHFQQGTLNTWSSEVGCTGGQIRVMMQLSDCPDQSSVSDINMSCPSGHSSSSAAVSFLVVLHLRRFLGQHGLNVLVAPFRAVFTVFFLLWPMICALTRVWDNKHSTADVAIGFLVGVFCALISNELWIESEKLSEELKLASKVISPVPETHSEYELNTAANSEAPGESSPAPAFRNIEDYTLPDISGPAPTLGNGDQTPPHGVF